jgi:subtilisin family serine protease
LRILLLALALLAGMLVSSPSEPIGAVAAAAPPRPPSERPVVAIIDSGVARTSELRHAVVAEFDMAAMPARQPFQPADDHGTMVATILLREAKRPIDIVSLRIDDPAGCPVGHSPPCQGAAAPVANAIRKATELGVSAINISLNLKEHPTIVAAVREAADKGIKVVIAAGNDGFDHPRNLSMARAGYPNTILVGALDSRGRPWKGTNRPQEGTPGYIYVWQHGVGVPTSTAKGTSAVATGTSFAAPIETAHLLRKLEFEMAPPATNIGQTAHAVLR